MYCGGGCTVLVVGCVCVCVRVCMRMHAHTQSGPTLGLMDYIACQASLSMEFSRQEYCNGLPFPTPGSLPNPGTELVSPASPALAGR